MSGVQGSHARGGDGGLPETPLSLRGQDRAAGACSEGRGLLTVMERHNPEEKVSGVRASACPWQPEHQAEGGPLGRRRMGHDLPLLGPPGSAGAQAQV